MLEAASRVFGERGYTGATTDAVALAAGVSQSYVVRTFGSKKALFAEVAQRAHERTEEAFRSAAAQEAEAQAPLDDRLGLAYVRLMHQPGVLRTVSHLFSMGHDPHFGPMARDGFLSIYRLLRFEIRLSQQRTRAFLAHGMLINTIPQPAPARPGRDRRRRDRAAQRHLPGDLRRRRGRRRRARSPAGGAPLRGARGLSSAVLCRPPASGAQSPRRVRAAPGGRPASTRRRPA
ncbi:helix-turn-helix domain-containing protein [Kocuria palustris]|uniref:TetR/AcrR family transcriptional regulator n=1 Tax=Kocuria palustris TaxID=71999 RepID=UPI00344EA579